jgi:hypothetical protein
MPLIKLQIDSKTTAWRIADNFLELPKARRSELAALIEKELEYAAEKAAHATLAALNQDQ